ncbi:MAG: hypothetical protein Q9195_002597 [Heterodermia aff. obscurata]
MASQISSQALTKRSHDTALMPPPPAPKGIKRPTKVLDEDDYTDALSHIIARDFFPGLIETDTQQEYLNALDSQDQEWISSAGRKLTEIMTPGPNGRQSRGRRGTSMTPIAGLYSRAGETPKAWQGDTPMSITSSKSTSAAGQKPEVDTNMSLGAFQSRYTSEDNESFYKLLDKQNTKRSEKYAWMWAGNKIPAARQIAHRERESRLLANKIQDSSEGKELTKIDKPDDRKAMPDSWKSRPDNPFMFEPPSIEDTHQTIQQRAEETSRAPPKAVVYDNTRLPTLASSTDLSSGPPPSPSLSAVQDAIAGHPRPTASEAAFTGALTPRVNGYAFVDSAPSSSPSELTSAWGSGDPSSLLGSGDATPNPFKIKDKSKREALHHRMVDKVAKGKRGVGKREGELVNTPVPRFASSPRIAKGGLTPAAQKLLGKVGGGGMTPSLWGAKEGQSLRRSGLRQVSTPRKQVNEG